MSKSAKILKLLRSGKSIKEVAKATKSSDAYVYYVRWNDKQKAVKTVKKALRQINAQEKLAKKKPSKIIKAVRITKDELTALLPKPDLVNKPPHYTTGGVDFLDYAEAKGLTENAYLFNVVKYVSRAGKKVDADPVQDLQKAEFYLKREIERRKSA